MSQSLNALKKITIAAINGKRGGFEVKDGDADRTVGRIYGRADSVESKESNYGPFLRFKGQFRAVNEDREESFAPVLILPSPADSMLAEAVKNDETGLGVTFAFDVVLRSIPRRSPVDRGYEYIVKAHTQVEASDPMKALAAALPPLPPKAGALPAPEAAAPAAAPAEETAAAPAKAKAK